MSDYFANAYALLIAVNKSAEPRAALPDVAKDVDALAALLTHPQRCGYDPANVKILKDENSARAGILSGLDWLSQKIQSDPSQNATAVLYFTGHGHTEDGAYYLIPCDINLKRIKSSALSATDFAADVLALQPKRLLVMLDCCHAAGMDAKALTDAFAGVAIPPGVFMGGQPGAGADGSAKGLEQLAVGAGRAVLSSSQNNEKSWLRKDRVMSIFTYHVIEALSGHAQPAQGATEVLVSDVMSHVHRQVPHSAQAQHGASQQPDFQVSGNFPVALILGGKGLGAGEQPPNPLAPLAPASGAGARVVGAGGVLVEGNNTGNINTGTQIINTQGGAFVGGNVRVGGNFISGDQVIHQYNVPPASSSFADANVDAEAHLSVESRKLVDLLDGYFSMDDLEDVAFRMSIEWENLRGETKRAKARALVAFCQRLSRLPELKRWIGQLRPNLRNQL